MKEKINILIIDDHPMIVSGLKSGLSNLLNKEITIDSVNSCKNAIEKLKNKNSKFDLVILDINLPSYKQFDINSGEDLGFWIKNNYSKTKIIVLTSLDDNLRINNIFNRFSPEGFLIKTEATPKDVLNCVDDVLENKRYYSKSISEFITKRNFNPFTLDKIDINILHEISNGTKAVDLPKYIPLSKSGIEKRKRKLKENFCTKGESDRELILAARERGYI